VHAVSDRGVGKVRELYAEHGIEITEEQAREVLQQSMWYFYQLWLGHEGLEEGSGEPPAGLPTTGSGPPEGTVPG